MTKLKSLQLNNINIITLTSILWVAYLLMLLGIDYVLYPQPVFRLSFFGINGTLAFMVFLYSKWMQKRKYNNEFFLPVVIALLTIPPIILSRLLMISQPLMGPADGPGAILLRNYPLLLMALILLVTRYKLRFVFFYSGGVSLFIGLMNLKRRFVGRDGLMPLGFNILIQLLTFLLIGYFINILVRQLRRQNDALSNFAATQEELTISRERNRMARELHDTLAHTLSALVVQLETAKAYREIDPVATAKIIDSSLDVSRLGLQETRLALKALRAAPLEDLGLNIALQEMLREKAEKGNLKLELSLPEVFPIMTPSIEHCLYRVVQEASTNVVRHANACCLKVKLEINRNIKLEISDDGRGFEINESSPSGHYGLKGIGERVELIGGDLSIISKPGAGTKILLTIGDWR